MWWPLCSKVTRLITPSLPRTCRITLPSFQFPRVFFHSPRLVRFYQRLVLGLPSYLLDGFPTNCVYIRAFIFSTHAVWFPSVACEVCLLHLRLLRFPLPGGHSAPTLKHSGSRLVPLLCRFHSMSKGGCSSVSLCQWSPFRAVGSLGLFCLMSCKESFLCPWSIANTFLPTMGIWKGWIAMWCLLSHGGLAASRSSVSSLSSLR